MFVPYPHVDSLAWVIGHLAYFATTTRYQLVYNSPLPLFTYHFCNINATNKRRDERSGRRESLTDYFLNRYWQKLTMTSKSSFTAFSEVDDSVAKPVLGSDGAARWQDFRKNNKAVDINSSVAPLMPLKKLDRALGTQSLKDERTNEANIRKEAGDRALGEGYTEFKRKTDHEEVAARKRRKMILDRVRPDDAIYFMEAETFEGSKFDYVFTTRDRGTGYYWDGMDSLKKELGQTTADVQNSSSHGEDMNNAVESDANLEVGTKAKKKKKKKSKQISEAMAPESDPFNPMEQVAAAIARRNQALQLSLMADNDNTTMIRDAAALGANTKAFSTTTVQETLEAELIAAGWESAKDSNSGKIYYFNRKTDERSWTKPNAAKDNSSSKSTLISDAAVLGASVKSLPSSAEDSLEPELTALGWQTAKDPNSGKIYYFRRDTNEQTWIKPSITNAINTDNALPEGWKSAKDATTGKVYYYDGAGNTSWSRPELG